MTKTQLENFDRERQQWSVKLRAAEAEGRKARADAEIAKAKCIRMENELVELQQRLSRSNNVSMLSAISFCLIPQVSKKRKKCVGENVITFSEIMQRIILGYIRSAAVSMKITYYCIISVMFQYWSN